MDLELSISEKLALELINKKFGNMVKYIKFQDGLIKIGIHIMLSVIKIEVKMIEISPRAGIKIKFVGQGVKSFMVKKVIGAFYEKAKLQKLDEDDAYFYSWGQFLDKLGNYKEIVLKTKSVEAFSENEHLTLKLTML
jgi:hypothetical protein